jgi:MSHA biogenesis protein MshQ
VTGAGARTMSMWIYPANTNNGTGVFYQGNGDCNGLMFGLGHQPLNFFWGGCRDANAVTGLPVNTWTFVGVVFTPPDNIKLYTGTTVETFTVPDINTATSNLWVGGETISNNLVFRNHFTGRLDELRIYNRALTDAEMATLANLP